MNGVSATLVGPAGWRRVALRLVWIGVKLVIVVLLGVPGQKFFYQGF